LQRLYGFKPWDVRRLKLRQWLEIEDDVREMVRAQGERPRRRARK
jgi:hypothetical protein